MLQSFLRETMRTSLEDASPFFYKETALSVVFILVPIFFLPLLVHLLRNGLEHAHIVIPVQFKIFTSMLIALQITSPVCYLFLRLLLILKRQQLALTDELILLLIFYLQVLLGGLLSFRLYSRVSNFIDRISNIIAEKLAKLKYKELVNMCCNLLQNHASFDDIERWLNENQDNHGLLKKAANYIDTNIIPPHKHKSTPLHYLVCARPPDQLVKSILQLAPDAIHKKNTAGYLPLHYACLFKASPDVIKMLFEAYPQAAKVQCRFGKTLPLHYACSCNESLEIIKIILDAYPNGAKVQNSKGDLPLHYACHYNASPDVIKMLLEANPQAAEVQSEHGLPLHAACSSNASLDIIKIVFEAYPKAVEVKVETGHLPLHLLCKGTTGSTDNLLKSLDLLLVAHLDSIDVKDISGRTVSDYLKPHVIPEFLTHCTIISGFSTHLVKLLLHAEPESCRIQDSTGMVPLHHACASNAPHFFDYVVALLDVGIEDSLKIQDNQGRTATQLATQVASITDENGRLPLHRLASRSNNLTVKALNLLVDAYPESITLPDKFGMLPFHHACLNEASSLEVLMFFINSFPESLEVF